MIGQFSNFSGRRFDQVQKVGRDQHHCEGFGGEVKDSPDNEIQEEAASEVLPGEGETVHDEGGGEPVEVHDENLKPKITLD